MRAGWQEVLRVENNDRYEIRFAMSTLDIGAIYFRQQFETMNSLPFIKDGMMREMFEFLYQQHGQGD